MKTFLVSLTLMLSTCGHWAYAATCGERNLIINTLSKEFGETQQNYGVSGSELMETWANLEKGTWTILKTQPGGKTCVVGSGHNFQLILPTTPGELI